MSATHSNPELTLLLMGLIEEAAELQKVCSKIYRFGIGDFNPKGRTTNRDKLIEEAGDVLGHIALVVEKLDIDKTALQQRANHKIQKFKRRHCL